jgi:Fe2+ transport system protein FeoA
MITLAQLSQGRVAHVSGFTGNREASLRLMEMGLTRGTPIEVVRRGSPSLFRVRNTRVSLSAELAGAVQVS